MIVRGKLAAAGVLVVMAVVAPASASAQTNSFSVQADQDVAGLDGRSKSYDASQGRYTTSKRNEIVDPNGMRRKQIAVAVEANAEPRTYILEVILPGNTPVEIGRSYPVGSAASSGASIQLTLVSSICTMSTGSFTVNEYAEQADGTPATVDLSFTGTCRYSQSQSPTFTGRFRLNARGSTPSPPAAPRDTVKPALTALKLSRSVFRSKSGTTIRYRLSEAARTTFTVQRRTLGRKVGRRCRRPTRTNKGRRRCARYVPLKGSATDAGEAGANRVRFKPRSGGKPLPPGRYRLVASARDAARNVSTRRSLVFRVKR